MNDFDDDRLAIRDAWTSLPDVTDEWVHRFSCDCSECAEVLR